MSDPAIQQDVGVFEMVRDTSQAEDYHCFRWNIGDFMSNYLSYQTEIQSPVFTVPDKEKCKWRLNLKPFRTNCYTVLSLHLVLDRTSDCKEVSAKFKLSILGYESIGSHECSLKFARTFKFATKAENKSGILSSVETEKRFPRIFTITCEILIETICLEDDTFSNDFGSLFEKELYADFAILVDEKRFPVHKAILASRSSVFAAMFAHDMKEKEGVVRIQGMAEDVVEEMLRYMYTGRVQDIENDVAKDLLAAADKYDLKGLRIICEGQLIVSLSSSNVFDLAVFANTNNAEQLKSAAIDFIANRSKTLIKTPAYDVLCQSHPQLVLEINNAFLKHRFTEDM